MADTIMPVQWRPDTEATFQMAMKRSSGGCTGRFTDAAGDDSSQEKLAFKTLWLGKDLQ